MFRPTPGRVPETPCHSFYPTSKAARARGTRDPSVNDGLGFEIPVILGLIVCARWARGVGICQYLKGKKETIGPFFWSVVSGFHHIFGTDDMGPHDSDDVSNFSAVGPHVDEKWWMEHGLVHFGM